MDVVQEERVNKKLKITLMVVLFSFVVALPPAVSLQAQSGKFCCIAGSYEGFQINYARPNCPRPKRENFTMVVKQRVPCTADVAGTVRDSAGVVSNWTGTLSLGLGRCCAFDGSFLTPSGNIIKFKGSFCQKDGKWQATGTWIEIRLDGEPADPCKGSGTWEMSRVLLVPAPNTK